MRVGPFELHLVPDLPFRLDGGAMFGVVPKPLWERKKPADDKNRIQMVTICLLIEAEDELVLVDTGIGDGLTEKERQIYAVGEGEGRDLPGSLESAGFEPEDVTHVVLSHLHFDHCGWTTQRIGSDLVPTFARATHWIARGELEHARSPNERDAVSYRRENFEPLFDAGVDVELIDGEAEPVPGIRAVEAPGHTRNMCIVLVNESGGNGDGTAVFWADLVPTAAHVRLPWVMGYDLFPVTTMESKRTWLRRAADGEWLSIFEHDPEIPVGRIVEREGRFEAEPVEVE